MKMIEGSPKWVTRDVHVPRKKQENKHQSGVKNKCNEKCFIKKKKKNE